MVKTVDSSFIEHDWSKHFRVYAGPGAGKTYFLIENIKNLVRSNLKLKKSQFKKILCITYTNVAVDIIETRLGEYNQYTKVSTIHKFITDFIIKPYQTQLKELIKEEFDINISNKAKITSQIEGLGVLHGFSKDDVYKYIQDKNNESLSLDYSISSMSKLEVDLKTYLQDINNPAKLAQSKKISDEHIKLIKEFIWSEAGKLTHDEILYFGYKMVLKYPLIPYILRLNFPFILVDEFQDTNPLQTKLIQFIGQKESIIGVVGDIAQSIYSFQGAEPKDFKDFSIENLELLDYEIINNRRSTDNIVHFCNYLRKKDILIQKAVLNKGIEKVKIIFDSKPEQNDTQINQIINDTKSIVLTRTWVDAIKYAKDIEVSQKEELKKLYNSYFLYPGDFRSEISEHANINWIRSLKFLIILQEACKKGCVATVLKALSYYIETEKAFKNVDSLKKLLEFLNLSKQYFNDFDEKDNIISLIEKFNIYFNSPEFHIRPFLISHLKNEDDSKANILEYPLADSEKDYDKKTNEILLKIHFETGKKLIQDIFSENSNYITTFQAKGAEFESVFVALRPTRTEKINLIDVFSTPEIIDSEFSRILYVACSRAINNLIVYIPCNQTDSNKIIASLDEWKKNQAITDNFYETVYL